MFYRFKLNKDGNIFTVTTPEGIINYNDAVASLSNYAPFQILHYESVSENSRTNRGFFGLW